MNSQNGQSATYSEDDFPPQIGFDLKSPPRKAMVLPRVFYKNRSCFDLFWAVLYVVSFIAYLGSGIYMVAHTQPRYTINENGDKIVSDFFLNDAKKCCSNGAGTICQHLGEDQNRYLQAGNSKFDGDEGIFEAFFEAPEIIMSLIGIAFGLSLFWVVLLRFLAKPIVILIEVFRVVVFVFLAFALGDGRVYFEFLILAAVSLLYTLWIKDKLIFAADMISYSTVALKENPNILAGSLFFMIFYVGNSALFGYFFIMSANAVSVQNSNIYIDAIADMDDGNMTLNWCEFYPHPYLRGILPLLTFSYTWNLLLLEKMRLHIIAHIVGSWHFHPPDERIGVCTAMGNIPKSLGTLSVSALISSIAERINKFMTQGCFCSTFGCSWFGPNICIALPLHVLNCITCNLCKTLVMMLTKYSVILHVFTGDSFMHSAKGVFNILSRHFKGGFVTAYTSKTLLNLGGYACSIGLGSATWWLIDERFNCESFNASQLRLLYMFLMLVGCVWFPILGIIFVIIANFSLKALENYKLENGFNYYDDDTVAHGFLMEESLNHLWIPPLASAFIGCISMMFFNFFATGMVMDIIDTCFLCFAIDCDNNIDRGNPEFQSLISRMPGYTPQREDRNEDIEQVYTGPNHERSDYRDIEIIEEDVSNEKPKT